MHDFVELDKEVKDINYIKTALKNIIEIEKWCKEQFDGKPEYNRRLPQQIIGIKSTEEKRENSLRNALNNFKQKSTIWENYQEGKKQGLSREEIKQKYGMREGEIALVERCERVIEEYDYIELNIQANNIIEIEKWCKEQFEGKQEYYKRLPRTKIKGIIAAKEGKEETEEQRELRLGKALNKFKQSTIWKNYQEGKEKGLSREKIKQEYGMREGEIALVERYERVIEEYDYGDLNIQADNIIKIEKWCKEQFEGKPEYSRRTPRKNIGGIKAAKEGEEETEEQRELRLGNALDTFKQSTIWKNYQEGKEKGLSREEIKQEYGMKEGEIALVERYERVIEESDVKKKITGQSIGQVSYTATVQECDEALTDLNKLIHEQQEITQKD